MSREIDTTKPLSEEDILYLQDRERWSDIAAAEAAAKNQPPPQDETDPGLLQAVREVPHPQDVSTTQIGGSVSQRQSAGEVPPVVPPVQSPLATQEDTNSLETGTGENPVDQSGVDPTEGIRDNYDNEEAWSYRELQEEASTRALPASGKREEIIERLRKDDSERSES